MNRKELEKLGLEKEAIDAIMKMHGDVVNGLKDDHKKALDTAQGQAETVQKQLDEANQQIEDFKKLDTDGIKKAADDWKQKAEDFQGQLKETREQAEKDMAAVKFDHALEAALTEAKAKNPQAVRALLKADDLKLAEDGKIVGLNEQLEKVKEDNDYLFDTNETTPQIVKGGKPTKVVGDAVVTAAREAAGLTTEKDD